MTIWEILGISQTIDQKQIKKVYAARVKNCHREEKPEEWAVLHDAYQRAIQYAKRQEKESDLNGSRTVPSPVKPVAREGIKERDGALEKENGQPETDETEAQWQEYFARIRAGQERSRKMLTEELPERLRGLTLQGEGTQKKRWKSSCNRSWRLPCTKNQSSGDKLVNM